MYEATQAHILRRTAPAVAAHQQGFGNLWRDFYTSTDHFFYQRSRQSQFA
jgi:hypothetical protein